MTNPTTTQRLEALLGHTFKNPELLSAALTHKSYLNENPSHAAGDNERLEFLGDAVLDLVIGDLVMRRFPSAREGELSIARAAMVNEHGLAELAIELDLGELLFLGRGEEQTGGRKKPSLLADAMEAVTGAVFLDAGFEVACSVIAKLFGGRIEALDDPGYTDFKTRLQELAQGLYKETPRYAVAGEAGPDHDKRFQVVVSLGNRQYASAVGRSKKEAEQKAAEAALFLLQGEDRSR